MITTFALTPREFVDFAFDNNLQVLNESNCPEQTGSEFPQPEENLLSPPPAESDESEDTDELDGENETTDCKNKVQV